MGPVRVRWTVILGSGNDDAILSSFLLLWMKSWSQAFDSKSKLWEPDDVGRLLPTLQQYSMNI